MTLFNLCKKLCIAVTLAFIASSCKASFSSFINEKDYFDIARTIDNKRGRNLVLTNIMRDHTGKNPDKSYLYSQEREDLDQLIENAIRSPSYHDFSNSSGKLMIIKDFEKQIGIHRTPKGDQIESNRLTLFFGGVEKIIEEGKPWNGSLGALLTGFPDNPNRSYKNITIPTLSKKKDSPKEEIKIKEEVPNIKSSSKLDEELLKKHKKPSRSKSISSDSCKKKHSKKYKRHRKSSSVSSKSVSSDYGKHNKKSHKKHKKRSRSRAHDYKYHKEHHKKYGKSRSRSRSYSSHR